MTPNKKNIINTLWDSHLVSHDEQMGDIIFIDTQLLHEVTSPQAFSMIEDKNLSVLFPERHFATLDHSIPTDKKREKYIDENAEIQVQTLRENTKKYNIKMFDFENHQGIVHVIGPELGITQPGKTMVCGDSHTSTHGAFGALAFGIGTTQIAHVLATQCLFLQRPRTMKVVFQGKPSKYFTAKDAVLSLIAQIGIQGANGHAIEFYGDFIRQLSMEGRMTICNMSIECGARFGIISPDETTFDYLKNKPHTKEIFAKKLPEWKKLASGEDAEYDTIVKVDIEEKNPMVTWGTNPEQCISITEVIPEIFPDKPTEQMAQKALEYNGLRLGQKLTEVFIDYAFVGSCTNARIEDLRSVGEIFAQKKVHEGVICNIVPGSELVYQQAKKEGLINVFEKAGAQVRRPGCSMCIAMNGDIIPEGKRCASSSNRNFVGRQGGGSFTHLMSPTMVALASVTGKITNPEIFFNEKINA